MWFLSEITSEMTFLAQARMKALQAVFPDIKEDEVSRELLTVDFYLG